MMKKKRKKRERRRKIRMNEDEGGREEKEEETELDSTGKKSKRQNGLLKTAQSTRDGTEMYTLSNLPRVISPGGLCSAVVVGSTSLRAWNTPRAP